MTFDPNAMRGLPKSAQIYIVLVALIGAISLVAAAIRYPISPVDWLIIVPGLLLSAVASLFKVPVLGFRRGENSIDNSSISLGLLPTFLLLLAFGPFVGALAGLVTALVATCYPRRSLLAQIVFSIAAVVLAVFAASPILQYAHLALPGYTFPLRVIESGEVPIYQAVAILGAGLIYFTVNTALVAVVIGLSSKKHAASAMLALWRDNFLWMAPGYLAGASAAALLYVLLPYAIRYWQAGLALVLLAVPIPFLIYTAARYHREREVNHQQYIAELERGREELRQLYTATVESFALAIDAKDRYTQEHIQRVKSYAVDLAAEMCLGETERKAVEYGALLHDIGKIAIPETILCKPGKLTDEEFETMKTHTTIGAKILEPVRFPFPVIEVVRSHHERWDGTGYPDRLKGEEIPIGARILAVTDVYDALTTDRAYRRAWSRAETILYLQKHMGTHFDASVVTAFLRVLQREDERAAALIDGPPAETSQPTTV